LNYSKTDEKGEFNFTCTVPESVYPGLLNITIKSNRTYIHNEFWNISNITILSSTTINLTAQNSVGKGNDLNIVGSLFDQSNLGMIDEIINIYWDDEFLSYRTTDESGGFRFNKIIESE